MPTMATLAATTKPSRPVFSWRPCAATVSRRAHRSISLRLQADEVAARSQGRGGCQDGLCCGGGRAKCRRLPCGGRPAVPAGSHGSQDGEVAALQTGRQQTGLVHWWEASHSDCSCQTTLHERQRPAGQQAPTHCWKQSWRCNVLQSVTTRYPSPTTARKRLLPAAT